MQAQTPENPLLAQAAKTGKVNLIPAIFKLADLLHEVCLFTGLSGTLRELQVSKPVRQSYSFYWNYITAHGKTEQIVT